MKLPKQYANTAKPAKIDLTLSVNPLGCSPCVLKALQKPRISDVSSYPKIDKLILKIAQKFDLEPDNIVLGNGSEQLIKLISQVFLKSGDLVLVERGSFGLFTQEPQLMGAKIIYFSFNKIPQLKMVKLCFIANPKTATGEIIEQNQIVNLAKTVKPGIVVVDEANGEFLDQSAISLIKKSLISLFCVFSKALGLAGLRIGYGLGSKRSIAQLTKAQLAFPVSNLSLKAAIIAWENEKFVNQTRRFIDRERKFLVKELTKRKIPVAKSVTNNLFISITQAKAVIRKLRKLDVTAIDGSFFPKMPEAGFRISLKDRKTNRLFLEKFDQALSCLKSKNLLSSMEVV